MPYIYTVKIAQNRLMWVWSPYGEGAKIKINMQEKFI